MFACESANAAKQIFACDTYLVIHKQPGQKGKFFTPTFISVVENKQPHKTNHFIGLEVFALKENYF